MGIIGIAKDIIIVYVGIRVMMIYIFDMEFSGHVFSFLFILFLLGLMGLLQRLRVIPSTKG